MLSLGLVYVYVYNICDKFAQLCDYRNISIVSTRRRLTCREIFRAIAYAQFRVSLCICV